MPLLPQMGTENRNCNPVAKWISRSGETVDNVAGGEVLPREVACDACNQKRRVVLVHVGIEWPQFCQPCLERYAAMVSEAMAEE